MAEFGSINYFGGENLAENYLYAFMSIELI